MSPRRLALLTTAPAGPAQVEIQLGHLCNNRCVFCVSGQLTAQGRARPLPTAPALAALDAAAARGARTVTFLGGEPTLQASFAGSQDLRSLAFLADDTRLAAHDRRGITEQRGNRENPRWRTSIALALLPPHPTNLRMQPTPPRQPGLAQHHPHNSTNRLPPRFKTRPFKTLQYGKITIPTRRDNPQQLTRRG